MSGKIQLAVTEPCHENWNQMTAGEQGRFCQSCQKTVTDFSFMSDKEILNHLSQRNANVCGRFTDDQLNRPLIAEHKKKYSWAYIWNFMVATFLTAGYAKAQTQLPAKKSLSGVSKKVHPIRRTEVMGFVAPTIFIEDKILARNVEAQPVNTGIILDSKTNLPIPFASINLKGAYRGVSADSSGAFYWPFSIDEKEVVLAISAIGYEPQEYTIRRSSNKLSLYLDAKEEMLEPVVIISYPTISCRSVTGGVSVITEVELSEKMDRSLSDWTPGLLKKKEIKIYPNPVAPGATVTMMLSLKEAGDYTTEILDASGRIVYRGQISVQSKEQNITIPTSAAWNKGMYWVRLTGSSSKKLYHSKLVLQ